MHHDAASAIAPRAAGAVTGARTGFFMMMTIMTTTTRSRGASG
jgi:hypothetical protein